jgi:hypothetical protein
LPAPFLKFTRFAEALRTIPVAPVAPGLFAANANGRGVAAALALRVRADGSQQFEPIARFDPARKRVSYTSARRVISWD